MKHLLEKGAKLEVQDVDGFRPLHNACLNGDAALVELLLQTGADPRAKSKAGETPLDRAAFAPPDEYTEIKKVFARRGIIASKRKPEDPPKE